MAGMNAINRHGHQSSVTSQAKQVKAPASQTGSDMHYANLKDSGKGDQASFNLLSSAQSGNNAQSPGNQNDKNQVKNSQDDNNQGNSSASSASGKDKGHCCNHSDSASQSNQSDKSDKSSNSDKSDKSGKNIPPGLAKKQASDLPDGNPWKSALQNSEQASACNQPTSDDSADDTTDDAQSDGTSSPSSGGSAQDPNLSLVAQLVALLNQWFAQNSQSGSSAPAASPQTAPVAPVQNNATVVPAAAPVTEVPAAGLVTSSQPVGITGGDPATNPPTNQPAPLSLA